MPTNHVTLEYFRAKARKRRRENLVTILVAVSLLAATVYCCLVPNHAR